MADAHAQTANFSWNPFVRITDDAQAAGLAQGGAWAAGLVGVGYLLVAGSVLSGRALAGADATVALASAAVAVALAGLLGWRLHAKASAIAAGLLLLWVGAETAGDLWLAARDLNATHALSVAVDLFSLILATQALRGALVLRRATPAA